MSLIAEVQEATGATRADIVRVASQGGTTVEDWAIAHAIQDVTGGRRLAADIMWAAHTRSGRQGENPTPTVPEPQHEDQAQEETDAPGAAEWQELVQTRIWPDVARATGGSKVQVDRIVSRWTTARAALKGVKALMITQATHRPKVRRMLADYACAA